MPVPIERADPPYVQVVRVLRSRITSGELRAGDRLPSTRQISQEWGISHATATKVLAALRSEGLAEGVPGIGTIVSETTPHAADLDASAPEVYFQNLPVLSAASGVLITDRADRVLLLKASYRDHWMIPGGVVEHNEPPGQAAVREVREELGLDLPEGPLLVMAWLAAHDRIPRPMIRFIFDGGRLDDAAGLHLAQDELEDAAFFRVEEAVRRVHRAAAYTLPIAVAARAARAPRYLAHMAAPDPAVNPD